MPGIRDYRSPASGTTPITSSPTNQTLTLMELNGRTLRVTVTRSGEEVVDWLSTVGNPPLVGLSVQWTGPQETNDISVLSLALENRCLIYQILQDRKAPLALKKFLKSDSIYFAGVGVNSYVGKKLRRDCGLKIKRPLEVNKRSRKAFLVASNVIRTTAMHKSNWHLRELSEGQISHAALDVQAVFQIGMQGRVPEVDEEDIVDTGANEVDEVDIVDTSANEDDSERI